MITGSNGLRAFVTGYWSKLAPILPGETGDAVRRVVVGSAEAEVPNRPGPTRVGNASADDTEVSSSPPGR